MYHYLPYDNLLWSFIHVLINSYTINLTVQKDQAIRRMNNAKCNDDHSSPFIKGGNIMQKLFP